MKTVSRRHRRFEKLVNALSADLYRYALFLCHNPAMAEDLVQETFTRAWRFLDSLRDDRKAKSWLMTTLRREHARQYERYTPPFDDIDLDRIQGARDPDPEVWTMRKALWDLPEKYRDVLVLQVVGGFSGAEMAEILGLPRATVNTRLFRARHQLREMLEDDPAIAPRSRS